MMNEPILPDDNPRAVIGGNNPPEPPPYDEEARDAFAKKVRQFQTANDAWLKVEIDNDTLAERAADQIAGLSELKKRIDTQRVAEKRPWDDKAATVQAAYAPLVRDLEAAIKHMKAHVAKWATKKREAAEAERARKIAEARRAEEEAAMKRMDAERAGSSADLAEAERAQNEAARQTRNAARPVDTAVRSASGAGRSLQTRKVKVVTVKNIRVLLMALQDDPDVQEIARKKAQAIASAADFPSDGTIPGCEIRIDTVIV